ncbi:MULTISPECIES: helix-turn-helix domain-containing protein [Deefgea]|uniref:Winged helix-turn-helix domain-containing protein n=1 Tax=Deefgea chitinilytica TaxID=570276 RepID=A0ABS2CDT1_9NEIS|nr:MULTISPECIES: helix-turn-helix domain-containing protein [Deefgea]MBM5571536.1 hypothetical protein [Deefgea chitinilytica]MBM9888769.1 helix-turn-helix domain-containing protein [Deefgea sp. CFH1-16]
MKKTATPFENNGLAATHGNLTNTSAASQRQRVLQALRQRGHSTVELRDDWNIMQPAPRIKELRESGYEINTELCPVLDGFNRPHSKVAIYTLLSEPKAVQS